MKDFPAVKRGDWITVANGLINAVVCNVRIAETPAQPGELEVVYIDERDRAINDNVTWAAEGWQFVHEGPSGGYADRNPRLREYVRMLRSGRSH